MGHIRLGRIPATKRWRQVVGLLSDGAPLDQIAGASAEAAESSLDHARKDPALQHAFWLLTQLPLAARSADFVQSLRSLGLRVGRNPLLLEIVAAFTEAVDRYAATASPSRTDLGELAQHAGAESLATVVGSDLPRLFGPSAGDVRLALGKLAARGRFAVLACDFFARLTQRHLDYYLSRELSNHIGPGRSLPSLRAHGEFEAAFEQHCREASRIIEQFSADWFSKTQFEGGITQEKARSFVFVALRKVSRELRRRRTSDA